jgi:hypothetical protein
MACVWFGYEHDAAACAVMARTASRTGDPPDTACPHGGDGTECPFVKAKIAEGNSAD